MMIVVAGKKVSHFVCE